MWAGVDSELTLSPEPAYSAFPFPVIGPRQLNRGSAGLGRTDRCAALAGVAFEAVANRAQSVVPALAVKPPPQLVRIEDGDAAALRLPAYGEDVGVPGGAFKQISRYARSLPVKSCHVIRSEARAWSI